MTDSELIKQALEKTGWKQRKLAEWAGCSETTISSAKAGSRDLTEGQQYLIGEALGWKPSETKRLVRNLATTSAWAAFAFVVFFSSFPGKAQANQILAAPLNTGIQIIALCRAILRLLAGIAALQDRQSPATRRRVLATT